MRCFECDSDPCHCHGNPCNPENCEVTEELERWKGYHDDCMKALLIETDRIHSAWLEIKRLEKIPLHVEKIKFLATYLPEGISDEEAIDFVRLIEKEHGIV